MQQEGWTLGGNKEAIWIEKGQAKLIFDLVIPTKTGAIYAGYFKRMTTTDENGHVAAEETSYTIQQAHDKLGHANELSMRKTARHLGWTIKRAMLTLFLRDVAPSNVL